MLFEAGTMIVPGDGFSVEGNGEFTAAIEPTTDCA